MTETLTLRELPTVAPEVAAEVLDRAEITTKGGPVVKYGATEAALNALADKYRGATFDLTTTKGNDAARAARKELVSLRTALEARRKQFKAPALAFGKLIDTEAERITNAILVLEMPIDAQIKADEARREKERAERERIEAERKAKIRETINGIGLFVARCRESGMTAERIAKGVAILQDMPVTEAELAEFYQEALSVKVTALAEMNRLHVAAVAREEEAARLEAQRVENERVAAENARIAADLKRQADELAAKRAEAERQERIAQERREAAQREADALAAARATVTELPEGQDSQQVLKAEPATADATDRDAPADASPRVGAMGAGQAADAAPAGETPTLRLSEIGARLCFIVGERFMAQLGFEATAVKSARLYRESDWPAICSAIIKHVEAVRGQ